MQYNSQVRLQTWLCAFNFFLTDHNGASVHARVICDENKYFAVDRK